MSRESTGQGNTDASGLETRQRSKPISQRLRALDVSATLGRPIMLLTVMLILIFLMIPIFMTFISSFAETATGLFPRGFVTFEHWQKVLGVGDFGAGGLDAGIWFSLILATGGMILNIIIGVPIAYALTRYEFFARDWLNAFAILPLVPGVILGIAFLRTYPEHGGSALGLIVGYALLKSPYMVLTVQSSFQSMDLQQLEESARSLGASWPRSFVTVIVPNAKDGVIAGSIITWTLAAAEFNFTYMVYTRGPQPFAMFLYQNISRAPYLQSAAAISIYFLVVMGAIIILQLAGRRGFSTS